MSEVQFNEWYRLKPEWESEDYASVLRPIKWSDAPNGSILTEDRVGKPFPLSLAFFLRHYYLDEDPNDDSPESVLDSLPQGTSKYEVRVTSLAVCLKGDSLGSECTTLVRLDTLGGKESVKVMQTGGHTSLAKWVVFDHEEWPAVRDSVEFMLKQCRPGRT
jgi:hypothetical protein